MVTQRVLFGEAPTTSGELQTSIAADENILAGKIIHQKAVATRTILVALTLCQMSSLTVASFSTSFSGFNSAELRKLDSPCEMFENLPQQLCEDLLLC